MDGIPGSPIADLSGVFQLQFYIDEMDDFPRFLRGGNRGGEHRVATEAASRTGMPKPRDDWA